MTSIFFHVIKNCENRHIPTLFTYGKHNFILLRILFVFVYQTLIYRSGAPLWAVKFFYQKSFGFLKYWHLVIIYVLRNICVLKCAKTGAYLNYYLNGYVNYICIAYLTYIFNPWTNLPVWGTGAGAEFESELPAAA